MKRIKRGFTLIELLITISIVMVLATLIIVALRGVKQAANRAQTGNALRQMMVGYIAYATDNRQNLMPGYIDPDAMAPGAMFAGIDAEPRDGHQLDLSDAGGREDSASYVWRLAPYLDHEWRVMFADYRHTELMKTLEVEFGDEEYGAGTGAELGIARIPSIGLNSIYVGGDNVHGGPDVVARNPWTPADPNEVLAATRVSQVKNPSMLLVFAPSVHWGELDDDPATDLIPDPPVTDLKFGYVEVRAPFMLLDDAPGDPASWVWEERHWDPIGDVINPDSTVFEEGGGLPYPRWGDHLPMGHLDGSVSSTTISEAAYDMRLWSPFSLQRRTKVDAPELTAPSPGSVD